MQIVEILPGLLCRTLANKVAKLEDHGICDRVVDGSSLATPAYDSSIVQHLQMLGDIGLVSVEGCDQIADCQFSFLQSLQETEPEGLAQDPKASRDQRSHFVG